MVFDLESSNPKFIVVGRCGVEVRVEAEAEVNVWSGKDLLAFLVWKVFLMV